MKINFQITTTCLKVKELLMLSSPYLQFVSYSPGYFLYYYLAIAIDTRSFPIFTQRRVGLNNESFDCFKLKTMFNNPEADYMAAQINDSRITTFGSYLRKYGIDELPQLFNVLLGDMSIVGPRPLMVYEENEFNKIVNGFSTRLKTKPGITGLAQAYGYKGYVNDKFDIRIRYKLDLLYSKEQSFKVDLKIISKTFLYLINQ